MKKEEDLVTRDANKEQGTPAIKKPIMQPDGSIITDPLGSWTGVSADDEFEIPVQDVDDL